MAPFYNRRRSKMPPNAVYHTRLFNPYFVSGPLSTHTHTSFYLSPLSLSLSQPSLSSIEAISKLHRSSRSNRFRSSVEDSVISSEDSDIRSSIETISKLHRSSRSNRFRSSVEDSVISSEDSDIRSSIEAISKLHRSSRSNRFRSSVEDSVISIEDSDIRSSIEAPDRTDFEAPSKLTERDHFIILGCDGLWGVFGPSDAVQFVHKLLKAILASSSWDKTVRLWDVFEGKGAVETFPHTHDVLTVAYRPDGKQLACSTLDGQIHFWDTIDGVLMYTIEGRRDIAGGRLMTDRRSAANSSAGKYFTTLCYSADGSYILAGGSSKYICMYDIADQVLLRRFQITLNLSLDGVLDFLNSKKMTDAGPLDLIDDYNSDVEDGVSKQTRRNLGYDLPGSMPNHGRPVIRTKCLRIAPTGRSWAAATTEGVLVYSIDESFIFDPTDLDIDVTPEAVDAALNEDQPSRALILSLRLNEDTLIKKCIVAVSPVDIPVVASSVPSRYLQRLIEAFADLLESCPHLEFMLRWSQELCKAHGQYIKQNSRNLLPSLKSLQKAITRLHQDLAETCSSNEYLLQYLCSTGTMK